MRIGQPTFFQIFGSLWEESATIIWRPKIWRIAKANIKIEVQFVPGKNYWNSANFKIQN